MNISFNRFQFPNACQGPHTRTHACMPNTQSIMQCTCTYTYIQCTIKLVIMKGSNFGEFENFSPFAKIKLEINDKCPKLKSAKI